jgi:hypothetical protein
MSINSSFLLRLIFWSFLFFLTPGCFDEIQLDLPATEGEKLVVEGYVNRGEQFMDVFITVATNADLSDPDGNVRPLPVSQAYLIYNDLAFPQFQLTNNAVTRLPAEAFELLAPSDGSPVFQLFVALPDGRTFQSAPEALPPLPRAERIDVDVYQEDRRNGAGNIVEQEFLEIKITTPLRSGNGEKSFLRWNMTGVYRFLEAPGEDPFEPQNVCYIDHDLSKNQILLFNGRETTEETLTRFPALRDIPLNYFFSTGYYITVYQQTLSPDAYRYWDQLRQNASQGGGLFDPTPGSVQGNIRNMNDPEESVLGYFYATQTDTIRRLIQPGEVKNPRLYCFLPGNQDVGFCQDCLILPGSTLTRPDYWEE